MTSNMKWVMTEEYLKLRQKYYKTQLANLKANPQTEMKFESKTSKSLRRRDERNGETILQRDHKEKQLHT